MPYCRHCGSEFELGSQFCQDCGSALPCLVAPRLPAWMEPSQSAAPARIACPLPPQKSIIIAVLLAVLFGPLGMVYSTLMGALVMLTASVVLAGITEGTSLLITWPACILWTALAARVYNEDRR